MRLDNSNNIIAVIRGGGRSKKRVCITYRKESGVVVTRNIAFYSITDGYAYGTTLRQGPYKIKSFLISRIITAKKLADDFEPAWEVKL